jgi:hypothetical protein
MLFNKMIQTHGSRARLYEFVVDVNINMWAQIKCRSYVNVQVGNTY